MFLLAISPDTRTTEVHKGIFFFLQLLRGLATKSRFHYRRLSNSFGDNPVSFTPGFSQVNCAKQRLETVLKVSGRFPLFLTLPITRLKPGVNENVDLPFCAKRNGHLYISTDRPQQSG